jgi:EAL domain-containing protein (putative c-di-GMP-specific phosphodiesterase class I)
MHDLEPPGARKAGCDFCLTDDESPIAFTMAFQPIVSAAGVFAQEALVRGPHGESAASILAQVNAANLYAFDQACRVRAIELAAALSSGAPQTVSINFIPGAVYKPEACIRKTIDAAERVGTSLSHIIFEVTEGEKVTNRRHLVNIFREYRKHGLQTAIDDFGAGYAGLDLLAEFQPDILKLDMALVRGIERRPASRAIVRAVLQLCEGLGIKLIAEGVETHGEFVTLLDLGVAYFQGYLFARPQLEAFASAAWPNDTRSTLKNASSSRKATLDRDRMVRLHPL